MSSASYGANFTQSTKQNYLPTIFELLAQDNLSSLFHPASQHILKVIAQTRPDLFQKCHQYSNEIILFINYLVESYFLKNHNASFSENFYGLRRVSEQSDSNPDSTRASTGESSLNKLPNHIIRRSLLFLVFYPYIKRKFEEYYKASIENENAQTKSWQSKIRGAFLGIYPYVHTTLEATLFIFQIGYTLGLLKRHSPFLSLSHVHLKRLEVNDLPKYNVITWGSLFQSNLNVRTMKMFIQKSITSCATLFTTSLTLSMYFLQFLDWWHQSGLSLRSLTKLPTPDYPKNTLLSNLTNNVSLFSLCPLCRQTRYNETALAMSGFVFCYKCIHEYVKVNNKCPVTGFPCNLNHLVKIYSSD